ncbi:Malate dehydrogenase [Gemmata obscuriglobus]|uniref:Malate dehydrogenase n=1 Tax=Gemmata obscuriglobus TaxID=114 RepID=A0A2Z3H7V8_9BACT|nr:malate dehydrogenase [Gemmata obscuriglobus]AWM37764.1 malate dehydrogenase [Gemmata obscuriglobus]QEG29424.1 Malate dehydrogenase [Gemmata obscuriglobus]VTS08522.1 malate dehydrogenase : Malate dehydrogenase OS=Magnetococcus sp. (strain MC-1) GN=mdh PE=3 SV=1: Ldh_1_N: Ldh_1_C [Gemmata obscuriglobus UQM 2246]
MSKVVRVAVTGAAGRVSSSLIVRLASGEVFGPETKVVLQLLEVPASVNPAALKNLEGAMYELQDCGFSTLKDVVITDDPNVAFNGCNYALLVGAAPRGPGEQRSDLIRKNGAIFVGQGQAIAKNAASDVRILVVGNPCNTNCLIAYSNGRDVPADRWHAMTRLDHNRAVSALAIKAGVTNDAVTCVTIWGNHSNTQYPDFTNAKIGGRPATEVITDRAWLENTFVPNTQERGKFIIDTTKVSSSFSAANGAIDHVKSLVTGTPAGDWTSAAIVSKGEYGVPAGLVFGYPCTTSGDGNWNVVEGLKLDAFGEAKFKKTLDELLKEQEVVKDLLPS